MGDFENNTLLLLGEIKAKVEALEKREEQHEMREWVKVVVVIPFITILHAIMNKLGVKV